MNTSTLGAAHLAAALAALALGALVLLERKGTPPHRAIGTGYVAAILMTNLTALGIYRLSGHFGPFHALALASLATVAWGMSAALRRRPGWLTRHYHAMAWSYLGLLAAGCAEIAARVPPISGSIDSAGRAMALGLASPLSSRCWGWRRSPACSGGLSHPWRKRPRRGADPAGTRGEAHHQRLRDAAARKNTPVMPKACFQHDALRPG